MTAPTQKLIDVIAARTGTPRSGLAAKTVQELETILDESLMSQIRAEAAQAAEAADDELIRIQAEREADRVMHQLSMAKAREPHRKAEAERLLAQDRKAFADAARTLRFGECEANFSLLRQVLGEGNLSTYSIKQVIESGAVSLSPPTQQELTEWERERIERHNAFLKNTDVVTLRRLVREEREQKRQQVTQVQLDATQASAKQRHDLHGYVSLTPESRHRGNVIDARYVKTVDAQGLCELVKIYGDFQLNNILRYGNAQGA